MTTAQEIIDTVRARLADGTGRATRNGNCVYRTEDGRGCAVGCLLTDDEYDPVMEGSPVSALKGVGLLPDRLVPHILLLAQLQALHDDPKNWYGGGPTGGSLFGAWDQVDTIANSQGESSNA